MMVQEAHKDVIDVCGVHFDRYGWEAYLMAFADRAPGYLRKFGPRFCALAGADLESYVQLLGASPRAAVAYLIESGGRFDIAFPAYEREIRAQRVHHQVLHGWCFPDRDGRDLNIYVTDCAAQAPDLFSAWVHLSLAAPEESARALERYVRQHGARGVTLIPFLDGIPISDARCAPILEAAAAMRLPIWLHTGQNFNNSVTLDVSHIRHVDAVAVANPELVLIIGHGGWPWISDAVAICQRHENVFLEFSSHRPSQMPRAGSGWEPMLLHAKAVMRDRVLFGSSSWVSPRTIDQLAAETEALPVPHDVAKEWLSANAIRALGRAACDPVATA